LHGGDAIRGALIQCVAMDARFILRGARPVDMASMQRDSVKTTYPAPIPNSP